MSLNILNIHDVVSMSIRRCTSYDVVSMLKRHRVSTGMCLNNNERLNMSEYYRRNRRPNIIWHHLFVTLLHCQIRKINFSLTIRPKSNVQDTISKRNHSNNRNSRSQMFFKIRVLKIFTISQENACEICENFKNTFFYRTPPVAASETIEMR